MNRKGKLITLLGINGIGKSTQMALVLEQVREVWGSVAYLKYPLYRLDPTGPAINAYLREGNPQGWDPTEFQIAQTENRRAFDSTLRSMLLAGVTVVCEDYRSTGLAWAIATGVDREVVLERDKSLVPEDLIILLDGEPFDGFREKGHIHETNDDLMNRVGNVFRDLAQEFGWDVVNANQSREKVRDAVWQLVEKIL